MNKLEENYSMIEFENAYHDIHNYLTQGQEISKGRKAYILGGQPGSGKSNYFTDNPDAKNCIILNGDDYRKFHPKYDNIIANGQQDMPGKTQKFCNTVTERLIEDLSQSGYNMIIEGTLRNPDIPIRTCNILKNRGYHANLIIMACDAELAWKSTLDRASKMVEFGEYPRFVSIDIYNFTVSSIVSSLEKISRTKCFDKISVINRDCIFLYPNEQKLPPSEILRSVLNYENWKTVFPEYRKIFEDQKKHILHKANVIPEQNKKGESVLLKLKQNKKLAAEGQGQTAKLHKEKNDPAR